MQRPALLVYLIPSLAAAQCVTWKPGLATPGVSGYSSTVSALGRWDPDGAGPLAARLVVGGSFNYAGTVASMHAALWDGAAWSPIGLPVNQAGGPVRASTEFDPDGAGPQPNLLVVAGSLQGTGAGPVMAWNGQSWTNLSGNLGTAQVNRLAVFDPDGAGPIAPRLFASGSMPNHNHVCYYEDGFWSSPGSGANNQVNAMLAWDPDGAGPEPTKLYIGGGFTTPFQTKAAWNGTSWESVGTGLTGTINDFAVADTDGPGPLPERLIAAGSLNPQFNASAAAVLHNGAWQVMGTLIGPAARLAVVDADGPGPGAGVVYAGSTGNFDQFGESIARWSGSAWVTAGMGSVGVQNLYAMDYDGPGGRDPVITVAGYFRSLGPFTAPVTAWGVAEFVNGIWRPLSGGLDGTIYALRLWDHDQSALTPPHVYAGGFFLAVDGVETGAIAYWNGQSWNGLPQGRRYGPQPFYGTFLPFDPDGAGPQPEELIIADRFDTIFTVAARLIAKWNGTRLAPLGDGLPYSFSSTFRVLALAAYDADGVGPQHNRLIAAGAFGGTGYPQGTNISQWDGSAWSPLGAGLNGTVSSLVVWSPQGAGPFLYAGGTFNASGTTSMPYVAVWDGSAWNALPGAGLNGCQSLLVYDPDGPGPLPESLLASTVGKVREFTGEEWRDFGGIFTHNSSTPNVGRLFTIDRDGPGPELPTLIAAGNFERCAGVVLQNGQARWNGTSWQPLDNPLGVSMSHSVTFDPDGPGPILSRTVFSGGGNSPRVGLAMMDVGGPAPVITDQPTGAVAFINGSAVFTVSATSDTPITHRWKRDGVALDDGSSATGSMVEGSASAMLTLSELREGDSGLYTCTVTNSCGGVTTMDAELVVVCHADFDASGGIDGADVEAFFIAWEAGGALADVDQSGGVDGGDVEAFFTAWEAGGCG